MGSTLRIGGLASGLDIDELVEKLMFAERAPLDKLEQQKQTYEWTRDAYRNVYTQLTTFDTYIADNLVLKSFLTKTSTSSNSSLVDATATGSASGTLTIEGVSQLAEAARATGSQVNAIGTTKLRDLLGENISQNYIEIRAIQKDGTIASTATKIEFTLDMTVDDFVNKINKSNAGVSAIFENGRMSITAKNTGDVKGSAEIVVESGQEIFQKFGFTLSGTDSKELANNGKNAIFQVNGIATERSSNTFSINGYNVTLKSTFNSIQTIAEKFNAAKAELNNARVNKNDKEQLYIDAQNSYYNGADTTKSYTAIHNTAYLNAFGNDTLSLSEQEVFNKLGSSFWKTITDAEINAIVGKTSVEEIKDSGLFDKLTDKQIEALIGLDEATINKFTEHAKYQVYGTKLKDFDANTITKIKSFSYDSDEELEDIRKRIDEELDVSDEVKTALKSLSKEDLTNLFAASEDTLSLYQRKAQADDLKSKYNALGDSFFNDLENDEITTIITIDFSQEDAISSIKDIDEDLYNKLKNLSPSQVTALASLSEDNLNKFKSLAEQNISRSDYLKAKSEYEAAETRLTNAQNTFNTALADAKNANIILGDGENATIDTNSDAYKNALTSDSVKITSTTNVDDIVSKIKDFVKTYNGLITQLNTLLKEKKNRDFPPLTDAQKKEMDDDEIEKWEAKAKTGLLRNDSILQSALSSMRALVYEANPAVSNSKYNTLYSIGITTSNSYTDGGTLTIDENKLRAALEDDPDAVAALFTNAAGKKDDTIIVNNEEKKVDTRGYLTKLREVLSNTKIKIEKKAGRSTMTENSYSLGKSLIEIKERIDVWKKKLESIENRYWKQFTALETAVSKYNSNASFFTPQN
ncbi:flagellar filament capping protein FliD [Ureibacillus thermophilus]|uniref:Flagellar hook-associated protein 2 n=1 Tax=Ureibacillus thermophilus TaxID=367743 RepID=A0A4P6UQ14_9BACL|nr:flagellar filament capping protein FliD [Ureibacillus thermophilus]QBK25359.1 flagellar hook protein [Ureibacillus thermophilus]